MFNNRYVRLTLLTVGLAVLFYLTLFVIKQAAGLDLPDGLSWFVSFCVAGYLVYRFFAQRIG